MHVYVFENHKNFIKKSQERFIVIIMIKFKSEI
jgi:hypothetical protein